MASDVSSAKFSIPDKGAKAIVKFPSILNDRAARAPGCASQLDQGSRKRKPRHEAGAQRLRQSNSGVDYLPGGGTDWARMVPAVVTVRPLDVAVALVTDAQAQSMLPTAPATSPTTPMFGVNVTVRAPVSCGTWPA